MRPVERMHRRQRPRVQLQSETGGRPPSPYDLRGASPCNTRRRRIALCSMPHHSPCRDPARRPDPTPQPRRNPSCHTYAGHQQRSRRTCALAYRRCARATQVSVGRPSITRRLPLRWPPKRPPHTNPAVGTPTTSTPPRKGRATCPAHRASEAAPVMPYQPGLPKSRAPRRQATRRATPLPDDQQHSIPPQGPNGRVGGQARKPPTAP